MSGVPFVMTKAVKAALRAKGFSNDDIANMTPGDAHKLLNPDPPPANVHAQNFKPFVAPKHVPVALRERRNWLVWKLTWNGRRAKWDKIPYSVRTGLRTGYTRPENLVSYDEAVAAVERLGLSGVGFMLTPGCGVVGVDLDRCRNPGDGAVEEWAQDILDLGEAYAEYSPSGAGVRLFALGELPGAKACIKFDAARTEVYSSGRFLTFTGDHVPGSPMELQAAPLAVEALNARVNEFKAAKTRKHGGDIPPGDPETEAGKAFQRHLYATTSPFGRLNRLAIENLPAWVLDLMPAAWAYHDGYRVSSADLNRGNEEDLTVMPNGIVDFGVHDLGDFHGGVDREGRRSPIDLVIEWSEPEKGDFNDPAALMGAVRWLAGHLGISRLQLEAMGFVDLDDDDPSPDGTVESEIVCPIIFTGKRAPPRRWVCPDWIPYGVVTGLYGDGGTGKSLLSLQLQTALSLSGATWLGLPLTEEEIISFGVYCEDEKDEVQRREEFINAAYFTSHDKLERMHWTSRLGMDNLMMTFGRRADQGQLTRFYHWTLEQALDLKAKVVIVDTAADTFGGNENDRNQVRQYVQRALGGIALKINGAVVCCAHPSVAGITSGSGASGSTGWNNAFRSRLYLSHVKDDDDARLLERKKANYAGRNAALHLRWRNDVIIPMGIGGPGNFGADPRIVFVELLREMTVQNRPMAPGKNAGNYAPKVFSEMPIDIRCGIGLRDFEAAMETLLADRTIRNVTYGRPSRPYWKLVINENGAGNESENDPF